MVSNNFCGYGKTNIFDCTLCKYKYFDCVFNKHGF